MSNTHAEEGVIERDPIFMGSGYLVVLLESGYLKRLKGLE